MSTSSSDKQGDQEASLTLCPVIQQFLPMLALQELRPDLARAVHLHLKKCASCSIELEQFEAVTRLLEARWEESPHQKRQNSANSVTSHNTESTSWEPLRLPEHPFEESGALAFARQRNEAFRLAFAAALTGRERANSYPTMSDPLNLATLDGEPSGGSSQRQARIDAPSDMFIAGVRRSLARIAQQWRDPESQSNSEEHEIC